MTNLYIVNFILVVLHCVVIVSLDLVGAVCLLKTKYLVILLKDIVRYWI